MSNPKHSGLSLGPDSSAVEHLDLFKRGNGCLHTHGARPSQHMGEESS